MTKLHLFLLFLTAFFTFVFFSQEKETSETPKTPQPRQKLFLSNNNDKNNEKKINLENIGMTEFNVKYNNKREKYLKELVKDESVMKLIGDQRVWDDEKLRNNLIQGENDWALWKSLPPEEKQNKNCNRYFHWLIYLKYKNNKNKHKKTIIGVFIISVKIMNEISNSFEPYQRVFIHKDFQNKGINSYVSQKLIFTLFARQQIPFNYYFSIIHENNFQSVKSAQKNALFVKKINFKHEPYLVFKYQQP